MVNDEEAERGRLMGIGEVVDDADVDATDAATDAPPLLPTDTADISGVDGAGAAIM